MSTFDRYLRLSILGWAVTAVFGIIMIFAADELGAGLVFAGIAAGMGTWVIRRASRPSLVVSLVLGLLHSLEQAGYCVADVGSGSVGTLFWDLIGLAGGLCVVVGSLVALRSRARATDPAVPAAMH
jgi:hypothetical protein